MERDSLLKSCDEELSQLCRLEFFRGSGNGGQKRNKTSSAVRVTLSEDPSFYAEDCSERSQHRNRLIALKKLRKQLALRVREIPALPPERINCSMDHADYFFNLAHLLDVLEETAYDHKQAALRCGVSATAMLKLLHRDDELWTAVNQKRSELGLFPLRFN